MALTRQDVDRGHLRELGDFLRARRRTISPEENGLPTTRRRLVPGLSRDETAALADIGTSWYARLEAGRVAQPTLATMRAVSRALHLNSFEERFVLELAGLLPASVVEPETQATPGPLLELLGAGSLAKITVFDKFLAPVGWNAVADAVFGYWDAPAAVDRNPVARLGDPRTIAFLGDDYEAHARNVVGLFRRAYAVGKDSPYAQRVFARASGVPIFRKYWDEHVVGGVVTDPHRAFERHHETVGTYRATGIDLQLDDGSLVHIVSPADDASRATFARLNTMGRSSVSA